MCECMSDGDSNGEDGDDDKRMPAAFVSQVYIAIGQSNLASKTALMLRELPFGWALCRWGKRCLS